jgi:hypothetical protein
MSELKFSQMYEDSDYLTAFDLMNQGAVERLNLKCFVTSITKRPAKTRRAV